MGTINLGVPSILIDLGEMPRFSLMSLLLTTAAFVAWLLVFTGKSIRVKSAAVLLYAVAVLIGAAYADRAENAPDEEPRRAREADESNPTPWITSARQPSSL